MENGPLRLKLDIATYVVPFGVVFVYHVTTTFVPVGTAVKLFQLNQKFVHVRPYCFVKNIDG